MKKLRSETLLANLEERVENHLQLAVEKLQNMDERQLLLPPPDDGWSIAQCLWHLNSYGEFYLPRIKKGIERDRNKANVYFKSTWFGIYFAKMMEPGTGKRKIRAFKNHTPGRELNAKAVVAEFINQQEELLSLLRMSAAKDLNRIKIPLSIFKWLRLKLGDVFQFLIAHDERHVQQIKRILKHL